MRVNKGIAKNDEFIKERCSAFDLDELFRNAEQA